MKKQSQIKRKIERARWHPRLQGGFISYTKMKFNYEKFNKYIMTVEMLNNKTIHLQGDNVNTE